MSGLRLRKSVRRLAARLWPGRTTTPRKGPVVIYRPAQGVGIGHMLMCWIAYGTLARRLDAPFYSTLRGTILDYGQPEQAFLQRWFTCTPDSALTLDHRALPKLIANSRTPALITRQRMEPRALREFPDLSRAERLLAEAQPDLAALAGHDLIHVDSVLPWTELTKGFGTLDPVLRPSASLRALARSEAGPDPYLAVHLRHGNGEDLGRRMRGGAAGFDALLSEVAQTARDQARAAGIEKILCYSDNALTATRLAQETGGIACGAGGLPDQAFQTFLKGDAAQQPQRLDRMFLDLAVLAGATRIVAGQSLFARAAGELSQGAPLAIVPPP